MIGGGDTFASLGQVSGNKFRDTQNSVGYDQVQTHVEQNEQIEYEVLKAAYEQTSRTNITNVLSPGGSLYREKADMGTHPMLLGNVGFRESATTQMLTQGEYHRDSREQLKQPYVGDQTPDVEYVNREAQQMQTVNAGHPSSNRFGAKHFKNR